ncbi:MAG: hypothetical protein J6B64_01960 [Bacilli bacterium]|nr:hypothetical protein [Bacilli bacterium]MBP3921321.1 hypothetical protein [Bacilli bacterium]
MKKLIIKKNNENIYAIIYNLEKWDKNNIIIACHGFDSKKDGGTIKKLSSSINALIISFDFPAHGESNQELSLKKSIEYLKEIINYTKNNYDGKISLFGSSFGAYVILQLLNSNDINYENIFLKSAAINMDKILKDILIEEDIKEYEKKGYTIKNRNKKMIIPYKFYQELCNNKVNKTSFINRNIYLFHGTSDDTAPYEDILKYELPNVHIIELQGANHSFNEEEMEEMTNHIKKTLSI